MSLVIVTNISELQEFLDQFVTFDYSDDKFDDYYCINIKPFICGGCGEIVAYAQCGPHMIIIWENKDDDSILEIAAYLQKDGEYEPRIIKYNRYIGPCVEYNDALSQGWINEITH